jgi:hypothetical protein
MSPRITRQSRPQAYRAVTPQVRRVADKTDRPGPIEEPEHPKVQTKPTDDVTAEDVDPDKMK